jgi:hypothetical protein
MTYVHITRTQALGLAEYERVLAELGPEAIGGNLSHRVGLVDGELVIVDEWASRADADRFAAERLFPAFERAGVNPGSSTAVTAFEAVAR